MITNSTATPAARGFYRNAGQQGNPAPSAIPEFATSNTSRAPSLARCKRYKLDIQEAAFKLDASRMERLLNEPPQRNRRLAFEVINRRLPATFPGREPGDSLLHALSGGGIDADRSARIVNMLLRHGANPNVANARGETPAMRALSARQYPHFSAIVSSAQWESASRMPVEVRGEEFSETVWNQAEALADDHALRVLQSLNAPVDRSPALRRPLIRQPTPVDGMREGLPPAYEPGPTPPAYAAAPAYTASESDAPDLPMGRGLDRHFELLNAGHGPLWIGATARHHSVG